jgi:predicted ArsR family transcriptional regulator
MENHQPPPRQPYELSDKTRVNMLRKLALYWDGQWFLKTVDEFGLEAAVKMNARVRTAFGRIEMRTLLKAVKKQRADDLTDAMRLIETYSEVLMGNRLRARFSTLAEDRAEVLVYRCAAYEGAKLAGLERVDQACVACETLWKAWLERLLPDVPLEVQYPMRQGKGDAHCRFIIVIGAC